MNPLVVVKAQPRGELKLSELNGCTEYDVIVLFGASLGEQQQLDAWCNNEGIKFFAGSVHGTVGYMFVNLQSHSYTLKVGECKVARMQIFWEESHLLHCC